MLDSLIKWLNDFENVISVKILEDNKHEISNEVFEKDTFIRQMATYDFSIQGLGDKEFYVTINGYNFTLQVTNFEYETQLSFD